MRVFASFLLVAVALLPALKAAHAAPQPLVEKPATLAVGETAAIAPHRALYDMTMSGIKSGSTVADVSGTMLFEWNDVCDGWAIQQNMHLHFSYAEGDESNVTSNEVTWESKDGKRYNFNIRHINDGKETENFRGKANLSSANPKAVYAVPDGKTVNLTTDTLFPSAHTRLIIAKATNGERFFTRRVFDGTDEAGASDVSTFIGPQQAHPIIAGMDRKLASSPLLAAPAWPVHLAFFKPDDDASVPDYEMDLTLLANGVVRSMKIDYGDFSVTGTLKAIEPLPAPHC